MLVWFVGLALIINSYNNEGPGVSDQATLTNEDVVGAYVTPNALQAQFIYNEGSNMANGTGWSNTQVKYYGNGSTMGSDCPPNGTNCYHGPFGRENPNIVKTLSGLAPHTKVTIKLRYWSVDSWDNGERGYVEVDGNEVWSNTYNTHESAQGRTSYSGDIYEPWKTSGDVWYEDVEVTIDHNMSSLELLVGSNIDQKVTNEYWAVNSISVEFLQDAIVALDATTETINNVNNVATTENAALIVDQGVLLQCNSTADCHLAHAVALETEIQPNSLALCHPNLKVCIVDFDAMEALSCSTNEDCYNYLAMLDAVASVSNVTCNVTSNTCALNMSETLLIPDPLSAAPASSSPSMSPNVLHTQIPTVSPTTSPTGSPNTSPTNGPTTIPTGSPTIPPTNGPTTSPNVSPTEIPTVSPTTSPTGGPTTSPTNGQTTSPNVSPTEIPTVSPTTSSPTGGPTTSPTNGPTTIPTGSPTISPTNGPTTIPTGSPTISPTNGPTTSPNVSPAEIPTVSPTTSPTGGPTISPTNGPTTLPTGSPTISPNVSPTENPTVGPTLQPTNEPTDEPTANPTSGPTTSPTNPPTMSPTDRHLAGDGEWSLSAIYLHRVMKEDDMIYFKWKDAEHNVMLVQDYDGTQKCHDGHTVTESTTSGGYHHVNYTFTTNKTYYFYCNKFNHCESGMEKTVTVLPKGVALTNATPGLYNDPYDQMNVKGCALGTYQDEHGGTSCKPSTSCEAGKYVFNYLYSNTSEAKENRDCKTCSIDRYSTSDNVQSCTSCETGKRANMQRTGCEDADGEDMPVWVWGAIAGGAGVVLIGVIIFLRNKAMKRQSYEKIEDNTGVGEDREKAKVSNIRALIF